MQRVGFSFVSCLTRSSCRKSIAIPRRVGYIYNDSFSNLSPPKILYAPPVSFTGVKGQREQLEDREPSNYSICMETYGLQDLVVFSMVH